MCGLNLVWFVEDYSRKERKQHEEARARGIHGGLLKGVENQLVGIMGTKKWFAEGSGEAIVGLVGAKNEGATAVEHGERAEGRCPWLSRKNQEGVARSCPRVCLDEEKRSA